MSEPFIHIDEMGTPRALSCLLSPLTAAQSVFTDWSQVLRTIPRHDWAEVDYSEWLPPVLDQGSTPECGGFSTAAAHTAACQLSGRLLPTYLSPGWIYGYCKEPLGGIHVRNALLCLRDRGCPLVSSVGAFDIAPAMYSDATRQEARQYKLTAAYQVKNFDELGSAATAGLPGRVWAAAGGRLQAGGRGHGARLRRAVAAGWSCHVRLRCGQPLRTLVRARA